MVVDRARVSPQDADVIALDEVDGDTLIVEEKFARELSQGQDDVGADSPRQMRSGSGSAQTRLGLINRGRAHLAAVAPRAADAVDVQLTAVGQVVVDD